MVVVPNMSWTILLMTIVDPTNQGMACSSVSKGWDRWLLLRVLAISAKPGGGVHGRVLIFSSGISAFGIDVVSLANPNGSFHLHILGLLSSFFTHWVKIFGAPAFWVEPAGVFTVEGTMNFEHPIPMVGFTLLVLTPWSSQLLCF